MRILNKAMKRITNIVNEEKELFDLVDNIGEILDGNCHIIHLLNSEMEIKYRVYHQRGYYFDISRIYICEPEETDQFEGVCDDGFGYYFISEWENFIASPIEQAIKLVKRISE